MILEGPLEKGWKEALDKRGVNFSEIYFVKLEIIQFIDLNCFKLTWTHFSNFFDFMFSQSIPRCTIFQIAIPGRSETSWYDMDSSSIEMMATKVYITKTVCKQQSRLGHNVIQV